MPKNSNANKNTPYSDYNTKNDQLLKSIKNTASNLALKEIQIKINLGHTIDQQIKNEIYNKNYKKIINFDTVYKAFSNGMKDLNTLILEKNKTFQTFSPEDIINPLKFTNDFLKYLPYINVSDLSKVEFNSTEFEIEKLEFVEPLDLMMEVLPAFLKNNRK